MLGFPDAPAPFDLVLTQSDDEMITGVRRPSLRSGSGPIFVGRFPAVMGVRVWPSATATSPMRRRRPGGVRVGPGDGSTQALRQKPGLLHRSFVHS